MYMPGHALLGIVILIDFLPSKIYSMTCTTVLGKSSAVFAGGASNRCQYLKLEQVFTPLNTSFVEFQTSARSTLFSVIACRQCAVLLRAGPVDSR